MRMIIVFFVGNYENKNYVFYDYFNVKQLENVVMVIGVYYFYDYSNVYFIVLNFNENLMDYVNFLNE